MLVASLYLQKGAVIDIPTPGLATLRLDSGSYINEMKEKHLETVLPKIGESCILLIGPHKGQIANLVEKQKEKEVVIVELVDDLTILQMSMDAVAAQAFN